MSQSGKYLLINSPGDYYESDACCLVFDCEKALLSDDCFVRLDFAATNSCTLTDGRFFAVGSRFSYLTGEYHFDHNVIDPAEVMLSDGASGVSEDMPGTVMDDIRNMGQPYGVYVNPYTGYIYATDAGSFSAAGQLYQWSPDGEQQGKHKVYINPGHFLALPPDGQSFSDVQSPTYNAHNASAGETFDLQGRRVSMPQTGRVYIQKGKKITVR